MIRSERAHGVEVDPTAEGKARRATPTSRFPAEQAGLHSCRGEDLVWRTTRHDFSREITTGLAPLARLDNWHGPLALATDWLVIIGVAAAAHRLPRSWWLVAYVFLVLPVIGARQRALATLLHESAHGVLAASRLLNRFLGTFPSGYLVLQSFSAYRRTHVRDHHGRFGDPEVDPDLRAHLRSGVYDHPHRPGFALRFLLLPLLGVQHPRIMKELVAARLGSSRRDVAQILGCVAYVAGLVGLASVTGTARLALLYWFIPLLVTFPLVNWYAELLEHFPYIERETLDLRATRHRAVGVVSRHFFGIHNEGFHLDHHLSPRIPFWNLPAAHQLRLADPAFAAVIAETAPAGRGVLWQFRDMTKHVGADARQMPGNGTRGRVP